MQLMRLGAPGDDALEHVSEPCHWLDAIELGGLYEGHGDRPVTGSPVGTGEERRFSCHRNWPDRPLHNVCVHFYAAVAQEYQQSGLVSQRVAHGLCEIGCTRYAR